MDSKLSPAQADPHHDGDVVLLAPKDWTDAEEALSKLAHVASDRRRPTAGSDFSAGPRVTEPSLGATLRPADLNNDPSPTDRPSLSRRTSRSLARFLVMACVGAAATLAWQSYGGTAKQMIANSAPQLSWLLSLPAMNPPSGREIAVEQPSPPAVQASAPQAASAQAGAVAPTASETAASTAPTAPSPEVQQLATMAHDLAAVRQSVEQLAAVRQNVEQLAAGQEQMARDIAKLQTAGQDIRRRISALPPAAATTAHKPVPPPQPALQSSVAPLPPAPPEPAPPSSAAPLPPAPPEPPSRPPMPVR
jgi:chemotaxis protein histidine kinase CheA